MKSGRSSTRTVKRRDGKSSIRRSLEARFRSARFKLEDLESRTLLSTSQIAGPFLRRRPGAWLHRHGGASLRCGPQQHVARPVTRCRGIDQYDDRGRAGRLLEVSWAQLCQVDERRRRRAAALSGPRVRLAGRITPIGPPTTYTPGAPNTPTHITLTGWTILKRKASPLRASTTMRPYSSV